jgi:hypothetical protein
MLTALEIKSAVEEKNSQPSYHESNRNLSTTMPINLLGFPIKAIPNMLTTAVSVYSPGTTKPHEEDKHKAF